MINKILNRLSKKENKDDKAYIAKKVEAKGVEAFKSCGASLKSDAKFVLDLVKTCPECLEVCDKELFDRYEDNGVQVEQPVDKMLFAALCCQNNVESFKYLTKDIAKRYMAVVENSEIVKGSFQGEDYEIQFKADVDYLDLLKFYLQLPMHL